MFDLKNFRETNLKMTQAEFAELIDVRQDYISRLEKSVNSIPLEIMVKIANRTGSTIDELINFKRPTSKPFNVDDTWGKADFTKRTLVNYLSEQGNRYRQQWGDNYDTHIAELHETVARLITKPKIAIVGHSDVGKSTLINSLLGAEKMPIAWTPTTSIIVYIKHVNDRPKFIEEDAWVFRASLEENVGWDEKKLDDEEYCKAWKLSAGSADILNSFGTRQGAMHGNNEAGSAVIFVDSDILKNCDILDFPGFGTGRVEDDLMTLKSKDIADVLIYMSISTGFMRETDIEYLKESINSLSVIEKKGRNCLKPLSNLFIVASQAHYIDRGNPKSLESILDLGCNRLLKTMPDSYWHNKREISGYDYSNDEIRNRFFTYTVDIEQLRIAFEKDFKDLVEILPTKINDDAKELIRQYVKDKGGNVDKEIEQYNNIISEREKYELLLVEINKNEPRRANENLGRKMGLIEDIRQMSAMSFDNFSREYGQIVTADHIVSIIKTKGFKKKKEDIQALVSYLNSVLQGKMQNAIKRQADELKEKIDQYLADFEFGIKGDHFSSDSVNVNFSFNTTAAFASGLAGLATFGGLAIWAASLGNLGAYILTAKGVSILAAMGISITGGTAGAAAAIAAIGGPIGIGIALAILAALSIYAIFSSGWENSIAKKIVKEYDSKNYLKKYKDSMEGYWAETETAFSKAAETLDQQWELYIANLQEIVSSYDVEEIERKIKVAKEFKSFLAGIPL